MLHKVKAYLSNYRHVITGKKRSPQWHKVQENFLDDNPFCEVCGSHQNLQVHHIKPFHLFPELELDPNNLITVCMDKNECHLKIAHGGNFKSYCPDIKKYAKEVKEHKKTIQEIYQVAKKSRID